MLSRGLTLATYLVLARLAAPEVFGVFAAGSILLGAGSIFVQSGMLAALIQRHDRLEDASHTAFVATAAGGVVLTLVALAASPLVGLLFSSREIGHVSAAMSGMLLLGAGMVVPDALLQRRFSFLRRVVVDPIGVLAFAIGSIAALAAGLGVWGLVIGSYASQLAQVAAAWKASGFRPRPRRASFRLWRELAGYGRHILTATTLDHVTIAASTFLLGRFISTPALGQYRYAARFGNVPQELAVNAGSYVLLPALARISHDRTRFELGVRRSLRLMLAGVVPLSLLLLPLGLPLVVVLLSERWRPAGVVLMVLCLASAPHAAGSISAESAKAAGRPDVLPLLHLLQMVLTIGLMLAFLPLGLVGVAAGATLASVLSDTASLLRCAHVLRLDLRALLRCAWPPYAAGAVMVAALFALDRGFVHADRHGIVAGLALLALEALAGVAVYLACLLVVSSEVAEELRRLAPVVRARVAALTVARFAQASGARTNP